MQFSSALRGSLPSSIEFGQLRAAVRCVGSPGSLAGETWLLDVGGKIAVLTRSSIFDTLTWVELDARSKPVELRDGAQLEVHQADGRVLALRPSEFELPSVTALLEATHAGPSGFEGDRATRETTLPDLEAVDPNIEGEAAEAIAAGDYERAIAAVSALGQQSSPLERRECDDLVALLSLLRSGDRVAAYLWTRGGVREPPSSTHDALFSRLADDLERFGEPTLAWAAIGELLVDDSGAGRRARIEAALGRDGVTLTREVARRARDFFAPLAGAGDPLAQRGLGYALMELDELDEALTWVRRAITRDRRDFGARMLETQVLRLRAIGEEDDGELVAAFESIAADFPDRPEPLVDLAEHLEYRDPFLAIDLLQVAQVRNFDEFVLLDLLELLASNMRWHDVVSEVEAALADPDSIRFVTDELHDKLAAARRALRGQSGRARSSTVGSQTAQVVALVVATLVIAAAVAVLLYG